MSKVKEYRKRRYARLMARADAADDDKGRWITTENGHKVHLNEEGVPDKGNPHVIAAMNGESSGGKNGSSSSNAGSNLGRQMTYDLRAWRAGDLPEDTNKMIRNSFKRSLDSFAPGTIITCGKEMMQKMSDGKWINGSDVFESGQVLGHLQFNDGMYSERGLEVKEPPSRNNANESSSKEVSKRRSVDFLKKSGAGWYAGMDDFQESFEDEGFSVLDMSSEYATIEDEAGNQFTVKYDVTSTGRTLQIDTIEDEKGKPIYEAPTRDRLLRQQEEDPDDDWDDEDDEDEEDW